LFITDIASINLLQVAALFIFAILQFSALFW